MNDDLKELKARLSQDKRFAEMTISFSGKNLKECFPALSREERADAVRTARALLLRWNQEDNELAWSPYGQNASLQSDPEIAAGTSDKIPLTQDVATPESGAHRQTGDKPQLKERWQQQEFQDANAHSMGQFPDMAPAPIPEGYKSANANRIGRGGKWVLLFTGTVAIILTAAIIAQDLMLTQPTNIDITGLFESKSDVEPKPEANQSTTAPQQTTQPDPGIPEPSSNAPNEQTAQPQPTILEPSSDASPEQTAQPQPTMLEPSMLEPSSDASPGQTAQPDPAAIEAPGDIDPQQVSEAQSHLARLGYNPGPIDGIMGPKTRTAVEAFQQDHGLSVDGMVTESLLNSLKSSNP